MPRLSHKATQLLWATIKIVIVIIAGYLIYTKLDQSSFNSLKFRLSDINTTSLYFYIIIIILLTATNWFLEIKKWQVLVDYFKRLSFHESAQQTLSAHLIGFVTPAKAGDYGAKALCFPPEQRKKILFLNFIGNMYQLLATIVFGLTGLGVIAFFTSGTAIFFWGLSIFMMLVLYQIIPKVLKSFNWKLKGNAWHKIKSFWKTLPKSLKQQTRLFSFLRYIIFAHQFYFILIILGSDLSYPFAMSCIGAMYVLSSLVPVMQLLDLVVRGGVAILVFSWFKVPEEIVISTVFIMWVLNVVLPLIPGVYFLFTTRNIDLVKTMSK